MSSTESKLMWVAVALSLLLVLALGTLAAYSVLGQDGDQSEATADADGGDQADTADGDTTDEDRPPAAPGLVVGQADPSLIVRCEQASATDQGYVVVIANREQTTVDYVVSIELTVAGSPPLTTSTEVPALGPGERREVAVNAAGPDGRRISDCSIAAVQSDRRVLLANP